MKHEIALEPVDSSNISGVGYHPESRTLRVQFRSGAVYDYPDTPPEAHQALKQAESAGKHFHKHIRGRACVKVSE